jgi:hypothetical protein
MVIIPKTPIIYASPGDAVFLEYERIIQIWNNPQTNFIFTIMLLLDE